MPHFFAQRIAVPPRRRKPLRHDDETSTAPVPQGLSRLQRTVGNAALQRLLAEQAPQVQRAGETGAKTLQAPLFAGDPKLEAILNDRDRMKSGDRGDSVRKVQQGLLNDNMPLPQFGADGAYGNETSSAVRQFKTKHSLGFTQFGDVGPGTMGKLDELNAPKKEEPPPVPPTPKDDTALEDMLDVVWLQHQTLLDTQRDALSRLEADLAVQETPTDIGLEIMKFIVKTAAGALFGGVGGLLSNAIKDAMKDEMSPEDHELLGTGLDKIFEAAKGAVETTAEEKVTNLMSTGEKGVDAFIDSQRQTLLDVSSSEQESFLIDMKPKLRLPATPLPNAPAAEDPRVTRARKLVKSMKQRRTSAFDMQYTESLSKFAVGQAREGLGATNGPEQATDLSAAAFENLDKKPGNKSTLRGVIELSIDFDADDPARPVKVEEAEILGLSQKTRDRLSSMDTSLGSLGLPIVAEGQDNSFLQLGNTGTVLKIGQNEKGEIFESGSDDDGKVWLAKRGKKLKAELPDLPGNDEVKLGIGDVFEQDINRVQLKNLKDKLEKA